MFNKIILGICVMGFSAMGYTGACFNGSTSGCTPIDDSSLKSHDKNSNTTQSINETSTSDQKQ